MNTHSEESMPHVPARTHLYVALLLAVLTGLAFLAVSGHWLSVGALIPILLALAVVQIVFQLAYYMRLKVSSRLFAMFFACGFLLAIVIVMMVKTLTVIR